MIAACHKAPAPRADITVWQIAWSFVAIEQLYGDSRGVPSLRTVETVLFAIHNRLEVDAQLLTIIARNGWTSLLKGALQPVHRKFKGQVG
jgi:hypothetical protein